jgi:hypothetical protein
VALVLTPIMHKVTVLMLLYAISAQAHAILNLPRTWCQLRIVHWQALVLQAWHSKHRRLLLHHCMHETAACDPLDHSTG